MSSNGLAEGLIHSRSASRASTASFASSHGELPGSADRPSTPQRRLTRISGTPTRKAKRIRFFRNGDRFFKGVVMPVTAERYRSFDSLLSDVTRLLKDHVNLPNGVRNLFTTDGTKVAEIDELEDGQAYICSGQGEQFKSIDYLNHTLRKNLSKSMKPRSKGRESVGVPGSGGDTSRSTKTADVMRPRVVTLVRNGVRPRRLIRLLLNKRNAPSFEHALSAITEAVKLDTGAVRKVFSSAGKPLLTLHDFFLADDLFFVYGSERYSPDDFQLDAEEMKGKQKKGGICSRRAKEELSKASATMPKIARKKPTASNETRETDANIPSQVRLKYKVGSIVGDGNFAVVRRCSDRLKGGEYAMKIIDKSKCKGREQMIEQMIENEVEILRKVRHPNIIRLLAEFDTPNELYLIMELEAGDLFDAIAASTKFPEEEARLMVSHMASALAYLHKQDIVHRDIKPENLLVRFDENHRIASLKLGDFGLAQHVTCPLSAICGTPTYVAPEILCEAGYGLKVDIWAAGVIMYILLCGFPPFVSPSDNQEELFDKILIGVFEFMSPYWDDVSSEARDLIACMLQVAPELRFSAEDVLDHPWLHTEITIDMLNNLTNSRLASPARRRPVSSSDCQGMDFSG